MTEREQVIAELLYLKHDCLEGSATDQTLDKALALLKAQEPMLVKHTTSTIRCPKCNKQITSRGAIHKEIKYCWKCGQAVKWDAAD